MPRTVQTPRLDVLRWSQRLRAIYNVAPGPPGAWLILFTLKNQARWLRNLRDSITIESITHALTTWTTELSQFEERLARYRVELQSAGEEPDTAERIDRYFVAPVFDGDYSTFLDEPEEGDIPWPFFMDPHHPDVMTGAMLWNQIFEVLALQDELEPSTWEFLGCAALAPVPVANLIACRGVLAWAVGDWMVEADKQLDAALPGEEQTIRDKIEEAVRDFVTATEGLFTRVGRAATKLSWVLYLAGGFLFLKAGTAMYRRSRARRALGG